MFTKETTNAAKAAASDMENEGGHSARKMEDTVRETVRQGRHEARDALHDVKEDLEYTARRAGRHARHLADTASDNLEDFLAQLTYKVRRKPLQSIAAAVGLGIFAGILYRR